MKFRKKTVENPPIVLAKNYPRIQAKQRRAMKSQDIY